MANQRFQTVIHRGKKLCRIFSFNLIMFALSILLMTQPGIAQTKDTLSERVNTMPAIDLPFIGKVKARSVNEIESSNWLIGCETLDRDFADYDQYKEYLAPLGIKLLRMQAGWAKTEKVKGIYDWSWLDHIIDDAVGRGLKPWLQTSYGNKLYNGGGGDNLGAGMPVSREAIAGYEKWVAALVTRYQKKVKDWEVWNEPNFADNTLNTPEMAADFNIRTATIIKKIQPDSRISGMALGHYNPDFVDRFFKFIGNQQKMKLFDNMTYHDYAYNPDANYHEVFMIRSSLDKYAPGVKLRQGENGAPSAGGQGRGALGDYNWTELSQAKWDTRRMLGNLGHDIECSVFSIIDMAYNTGPIKRLNLKGILQSDSTKKVLRPKIAYYAIQNVTAIFDFSLERITALQSTHNIDAAVTGKPGYGKNTDRSMAVYGYRNKTTNKQVYTLWLDESIPGNTNTVKKIDFYFSNGDMDLPVLVDIISGAIYEIPASLWSKKGNIYSFKNIPVYDGPVLIADKSLVPINISK